MGSATNQGENIMSTRDGVTRRDLLGTGAKTALAGSRLTLGGLPLLSRASAYASDMGLAHEQLRTIGLSVTVQDRILADFKKESGVGSTTGTAATFPDAQTKILSGSSDYDCWETIGERLPAVQITKKITPIPTASVKNCAGY